MLVKRSDFPGVVKKLATTNIYGLDTEGTGLLPYNGDRLFSLIISDETNYYFNFQHYEDVGEEWVLPKSWLQDLIPIFENPYNTWCIANAKYDMAVLWLEDMGLELKGNVHCTQVAGRVIYNRHFTYGLDATCKREGLGEKIDEVKKYVMKHKLYTLKHVEGKKKPIKLLHYGLVPLPTIHPYGEEDGSLVRKLGIKQRKDIADMSEGMPVDHPTVSVIYKNEMKLTKVCFDMERTGIKINRKFCEDALAYESNRYKQAEIDFEEMSGLPFVDSPKTLAPAFDAAGEVYPRTKPTKTRPNGTPSFTKDVLETFTSPLAEIVKTYRRASKYANTYYRNFLEYADEDDRIHADIRQEGTDTGRISYAEPNLQNVPKTKDKTIVQPFPMRRAFIPTDSNWFFFPIDYDQVEYRLMLEYAGEMSVIEQVLDGMDIHTATAAMLGVDRDVAKTINFMLIYGGGDQKLATALKITLEQAIEYKATYFARLTKVIDFIDNVKATAKHRGFITNWAGRRCYFPYYTDKRYGGRTRGEYKAPNHLIQGGCADVIKFAMVECAKYLVKKHARTRMIVQVHDELIFEVHKNELELIPELKAIMESVYPFKHLRLTAGVEYSAVSWEDKKEWAQ